MADIELKIDAASSVSNKLKIDSASSGVPAGVSSFNGRTGAVTPQSGDYSYDMISGTPPATSYDVATQSENGLMSAADKTKLDGLASETRLTQTLAAGSTEMTFTNDAITDSSILEFETSVYGVAPTAAEQSGNAVVATFEAQTFDFEVVLVIT